MQSQQLNVIETLRRNYQQELQFLMVGAAVFVVDGTLFLLFSQQLNFPLLPARVGAFLIAVFLSWIGNRCWTFRSRQQVAKGRQLLTTVVVSSVAAVANLSTFYWVSQLLGNTMLDAALAFSIGVLVGLILNWLGANFWTYRSIEHEKFT
ncbi:GtrA family protein [Shewanella sp. 10N.286.45.A1]|uniref:GtrA family protein n=1 Tax=Shewanella sp. 10N.286.45.A1 TaxID=3229694 RepID=UPI00354B9DF8